MYDGLSSDQGLSCQLEERGTDGIGRGNYDWGFESSRKGERFLGLLATTWTYFRDSLSCSFSCVRDRSCLKGFLAMFGRHVAGRINMVGRE